MASVYRARTTFFVGTRIVREGELVKDGDPVVEGREKLLESIDVPSRSETATAAPDELRKRTPPRRRTRKSAEADRGSPDAD